MATKKTDVNYVDLLDEDKPIADQKFVCLSFVSPEKILKQKEHFYFQEFLKQWEFRKSLEKFTQFCHFLSVKHDIDFSVINNDLEDFCKEERESLIQTDVEDEFKTFMHKNGDRLSAEFESENYQTSVRGIKVRGSFPTVEEAKIRAETLRSVDPNHNIYVGQVGYWMPFDPDPRSTKHVEYAEEELNQLMHEKDKNQRKAKVEFENRVKQTKLKAIKENIEKAEETGNVLTQTIDKEGNLINVNDVDKEPMSVADIKAELFSKDNIKTD